MRRNISRCSHVRVAGVGGALLKQQMWLCQRKEISGSAVWGFQDVHTRPRVACFLFVEQDIVFNYFCLMASCSLLWWKWNKPTNCKQAPNKCFPLWELPRSWSLITAVEQWPRHSTIYIEGSNIFQLKIMVFHKICAHYHLPQKLFFSLRWCVYTPCWLMEILPNFCKLSVNTDSLKHLSFKKPRMGIVAHVLW